MKNKGPVSSVRVLGLSKKHFTSTGELSNEALAIVQGGLRAVIVK